jgi:LPS sulfotransferase NodH
MSDVTVRKIVLRRRNRVKTFVSLLLARQTGEWVVYDDSPAPGRRPMIRVDPAELRENVALHQAYYEATERSLHASRQDFATLWYEDLLSDAGIERALALIGVAARQPSLPGGQTWKLTPTSLRDVIANFDQLDAALRGTGLEAELHEGGL